MANLKSSRKRILTNARKTEENIKVRSRAKTAIKKLEKEIELANKDLVEEKHKIAMQAIDKAKDIGIMHKNKAAREKSRLTKLKNNME